ncbi:MAG: hypothetical protein O3B24_11800 [Verrucomicrobia bacterium]|nr:hypothetical protein [Verrucomicrobiota bacterium]
MNSSIRTARPENLAPQQVEIGAEETQRSVKEARLSEVKRIRNRIIQASD